MTNAGVASRRNGRVEQSEKVVAVAQTDKAQGREQPSRMQGESATDAGKLSEQIEKLNTKLEDMQRSLRFSVDDSSGRIIVKVVDLDTDEVIRQIPSEEVLEIMKNLGDSQSLLFNEEA